MSLVDWIAGTGSAVGGLGAAAGSPAISMLLLPPAPLPFRRPRQAAEAGGGSVARFAPALARLLVPTRSLTVAASEFQLQLVMQRPDQRYIEYHVTAGCNGHASHVLLMLSGNARLLDSRVVAPPGSVSVHLATVSAPWFSRKELVQVFDVSIVNERCPIGASPATTGTGLAIGGTIGQSFETSSGPTHDLQLPLVGEVTNVITTNSSLGGLLFPPINLRVAIFGGSLPLSDRVEVARPSLTGSGSLTWAGTGYIFPSAVWTDISAESRNQFLLLAIGAGLGILGRSSRLQCLSGSE